MSENREGKNLYDVLMQYSRSGIYPMHMPGHKRNRDFCMENPWQIDVTEVEGLDNLHHPAGILRDFMESMRRRYGTEKTWLLVNGSTGGLLAAISACCQRGARILMARNCHQSAYHAAYLLGLRPSYLMPSEEDGIPLEIRPEQVQEALRGIPEGEKPACIVVTSPTYEGVVSDIAGIAEAAHEKNIPLVVDEAHGAHFAWSDAMPAPAMEQGADLVVESIHKTLPALTQTALLHLCSERIAPEQVERYLSIYQTSSPSYVLMAGAARCMDWLERNGKEAFGQYAQRLARFREGAVDWRVLSLWNYPRQEPSKLVIRAGTPELTGAELAAALRTEYRIEVEMAAGDYVLAMTSVCDTADGFRRLEEALADIDGKLAGRGGCGAAATDEKEKPAQETPRIRRTPYEAVNGLCVKAGLEESRGRISAEYAIAYPPGIPFLVPGEEISEDAIKKIQRYRKEGCEITGLSALGEGAVKVCDDGTGQTGKG